MTAHTADTCWADPLSRRERAELARKLASWCQRFYNTPAGTPDAVYSQILASAEMSDLHLDVTERAAVPPKICQMTDEQLDYELASAEEAEDGARAGRIEREQAAREIDEPHDDTPSLEDRGLHLGSYSS
jgi:hypothetical protein